MFGSMFEGSAGWRRVRGVRRAATYGPGGLSSCQFQARLTALTFRASRPATAVLVQVAQRLAATSDTAASDTAVATKAAWARVVPFTATCTRSTPGAAAPRRRRRRKGRRRGFRRPDQAAAAAAHPARTLRLLRCPADPAGGVHPVVQRIPQRSRESGGFRRPALADADRIRHSPAGGVPLGHCRVGGSGARSPRRRGRHRGAEQSGRRACDAGPATVRPVQVTTPRCRRGRHSFSARPATT